MTETTGEGEVEWPYIDPNDTRVLATEVLANFRDKKAWRNPGFKYHNLGTALLGDDGAVRLFLGSSRNRIEDKYGPCEFFSVAIKGERAIIVTLDGTTAVLLDRTLLGNRSLSEIKAHELTSLCKVMNVPVRTFDSLV